MSETRVRVVHDSMDVSEAKAHVVLEGMGEDMDGMWPAEPYGDSDDVDPDALDEMTFLPHAARLACDLLEQEWVITWQARKGAAA